MHLFPVSPIIKARPAVCRIQLQRVREKEDARCFQGEYECSGRQKAAGAHSARPTGVADVEGMLDRTRMSETWLVALVEVADYADEALIGDTDYASIAVATNTMRYGKR